MITNLIINLFVLIVGAVFSMFPAVITLPTIGGYDIDSAMVTGSAELHTFVVTFWETQDMFIGFLFLMGYFFVKMGLRFLIGHRAPA